MVSKGDVALDTFTSQGIPPPPGTIEIAAFLRQVAAESKLCVTVGCGNILIVYAIVCVPESGQLLSV
jgi:hypothetical protein